MLAPEPSRPTRDRRLRAGAGRARAHRGDNRGCEEEREHPSPTSPKCHTFVLDTSVLLADPAAVTRFHEHEVVIPVVVITELEAKRHHPELGYFARTALRFLDDLRVQHGTLDMPPADR